MGKKNEWKNKSEDCISLSLDPVRDHVLHPGEGVGELGAALEVQDALGVVGLDLDKELNVNVSPPLAVCVHVTYQDVAHDLLGTDMEVGERGENKLQKFGAYCDRNARNTSTLRS